MATNLSAAELAAQTYKCTKHINITSYFQKRYYGQLLYIGLCHLQCV